LASPNCSAAAGAPPNSRRSNEWYTPDAYLAAVRATFGGAIDLDPFSCAVANRRVRALRYWTEQTDAFAQPDWTADNVFMNPPYSGGLVSRSVFRFVDEFVAESFPTGIVLVNNASETRWFQRALVVASALCLPDRRIAFYNLDNKNVSGNTRGQAVLLFGEAGKPAFLSEFKPFGATFALNLA